ncbi:Ger(x)C family spore germination protein [Paenibacillus pini]|uniref:Spore germination protein xc. bacillus n=1 Tax=Paenibacillus pini JCM 16418 TaxID=1236976 RepID=W7YGZ3_9BACL|nr:Ger(x)C family spore germination protein [Paenibacillus pini]GAF07742.1 spore germination protein xc. bacillus [Paenibacillus pini JCM 16418]
MKKCIQWIACVALLMLVPGCWNAKDIQSMAYVTALGLDFVDGKYKSYVQVLNFSNIAKNESGESGKPVPIWVGKGEGKTFTESLTTMYSTSQRRIFWGHLKSVICTERMLKHGVTEAFDMLNRYREVRYNILIYGTKEPLLDILTQKSILNLSPLETILDSPSQIYSQRSFILPVYAFKANAQMNETSSPVMLPSISLVRNKWYEDKKEMPMFRIDGSYFYHMKKLTGWLSEDDLKGARWIQRKLERSPINIPDSQDPTAVLIIVKPHYQSIPIFEKNRVRYKIKLTAEAYLDELIRDTPQQKMEQQAAKVIQDEIMMSYKKGLAIQSDIFMLDEKLYRKYPIKWHELHRHKDFILDEDSLKDILVNVQILNSGKYKERIH